MRGPAALGARGRVVCVESGGVVCVEHVVCFECGDRVVCFDSAGEMVARGVRRGAVDSFVFRAGLGAAGATVGVRVSSGVGADDVVARRTQARGCENEPVSLDAFVASLAFAFVRWTRDALVYLVIHFASIQRFALKCNCFFLLLLLFKLRRHGSTRLSAILSFGTIGEYLDVTRRPPSCRLSS